MHFFPNATNTYLHIHFALILNLGNLCKLIRDVSIYLFVCHSNDANENKAQQYYTDVPNLDSAFRFLNVMGNTV